MGPEGEPLTGDGKQVLVLDAISGHGGLLIDGKVTERLVDIFEHYCFCFSKVALSYELKDLIHI